MRWPALAYLLDLWQLSRTSAAMWDFSSARSFAIVAATYPFILLRILVFSGITAAYVIAAGTGAGFGFEWGRSVAAEDAAGRAILGGLFGFGVVSVALYWSRKYILYVVTAGHIAVMVEAYDRRSIPANKSQIGFGKDCTSARFSSANLLFSLNRLVKGVVGTITRLVWSMTWSIPIPGLRSLTRFANVLFRATLTYSDEIILAHAICVRSQNPWETTQDALVLYAQNGRIITKNAVWLAILMNVVACMVFILMLAPAEWAVNLLPVTWSSSAFILAVFVAWSFKKVLIEPFATASLMQVYFSAIEGQTPDPAWRQRLENVSTHFQNLGDEANNWAACRQSNAHNQSQKGATP